MDPSSVDRDICAPLGLEMIPAELHCEIAQYLPFEDIVSFIQSSWEIRMGVRDWRLSNLNIEQLIGLNLWNHFAVRYQQAQHPSVNASCFLEVRATIRFHIRRKLGISMYNMMYYLSKSLGLRGFGLDRLRRIYWGTDISGVDRDPSFATEAYARFKLAKSFMVQVSMLERTHRTEDGVVDFSDMSALSFSLWWLTRDCQNTYPEYCALLKDVFRQFLLSWSEYVSKSTSPYTSLQQTSSFWSVALKLYSPAASNEIGIPAMVLAIGELYNHPTGTESTFNTAKISADFVEGSRPQRALEAQRKHIGIEIMETLGGELELYCPQHAAISTALHTKRKFFIIKTERLRPSPISSTEQFNHNPLVAVSQMQKYKPS
ncbi:hypothetical protein TWF506_002419 [Arthrobotrys conoides]|uniref:F-box domain-containing protein n=1 Tax=Arthrobotrys conoides TaxID=74498 RepID=A0AAN8MZT3_9PEZI